jgi:SAM-dependent methyltransferase
MDRDALLARGGKETTMILERCPELRRFLVGEGVDFGCEFDPAPNARVLVDGQRRVWDAFHDTHEVHIRDINKGMDDWIQEGRQYDFVYSSHLLEHAIDPHAFLRMCHAILRPGGHLVLVLPDADWYWPNGHPHANPDHKWWHLTPEKVLKWITAAFCDVATEPLTPAFRSDGRACRGGDWSFVLVVQKPGG